MNHNFSTLLEFEKLHNTRDLGGMKNSDGRSIVPGKLIRSGHLSKLPESDIVKLHEMIDTIVDFRSDEELGENPDVIFPDVSYRRLLLVDSTSAGISREQKAMQELVKSIINKPAEAKKYMCGMYRSLALSERISLQYAALIRLLLENHEKAVLWHCTAGKDRAGIASVIVEEILGIPREDIIADYLKTGEYLTGDVNRLIAFIKKMVAEVMTFDDAYASESLNYLFSTEKEYIENYYLTLEEKFGSFENYIREGLGLTEEEVSEFREKYLV